MTVPPVPPAYRIPPTDRYHTLPEIHIQGDAPKSTKMPWGFLGLSALALYLTLK